jgi:peptidoglycan/LPS O-acetylase OafA/YrhL
LLFAIFVVVSHSIQLGQFTRYDFWRQIFSSEVAVQGFFILSGFLVLGSYARAQDIRKFYLRRFLRIYPGYLVAVALFLVLALTQAYVQRLAIDQGEIYRYIMVNFLLLNFLQPGIDGVFQVGAYQEINGALWTIKLEVMFYALVPLLYWAGRRWSFRATAIALIVIGLSWRPLLGFIASTGGINVHASIAHQLPGQLHFFGMGVLMFSVLERPHHRLGNAIIVLVAVLLAGLVGEKALAVQILLLSLFIYGVTQLPQMPSPIGDTDLSYGVYLAHFPIIQLLVGAAAPSLGFVPFLVLVLLLATTYALASWHWVELPSMRLARGVAA